MLKASFSKNVPAKIEYIVVVGYIEEVGCPWQTGWLPRDRPFSPASDDAERTTATGVMVKISKQHAKSCPRPWNIGVGFVRTVLF
jgi:hypothetical protein